MQAVAMIIEKEVSRKKIMFWLFQEQGTARCSAIINNFKNDPKKTNCPLISRIFSILRKTGKSLIGWNLTISTSKRFGPAAIKKLQHYNLPTQFFSHAIFSLRLKKTAERRIRFPGQNPVDTGSDEKVQ